MNETKGIVAVHAIRFLADCEETYGYRRFSYLSLLV